jgi:superfamily II DNA/RNA helicase
MSELDSTDVVVPTRELASQVHAVLGPLAASVGLRVATVYGGVPQKPQVARLRDRADIVVVCPDRPAALLPLQPDPPPPG